MAFRKKIKSSKPTKMHCIDCNEDTVAMVERWNKYEQEMGMATVHAVMRTFYAVKGGEGVKKIEKRWRAGKLNIGKRCLWCHWKHTGFRGSELRPTSRK